MLTGTALADEGEGNPGPSDKLPAEVPESIDEPVVASEPSPLPPVEEVYAQAYALFARGELDAAVPLFEEVLRRDPSHRKAKNYLAESLHVLGGASKTPRETGGSQDLENEPPASETEVPDEESEATESSSGEESAVKRATAERLRRNPRSDGKGGVGIGLFGPAVGVSVWFQYRPHWVVGLLGGVGGMVPTVTAATSGLGAFFGEVHFLPIPWKVTPLVGGGFSVLAGPQAAQVDSVGGVVGTAERLRVVVYLLVGARVDLRNGLSLSAGLGLLPTGLPELPFSPIPSLRAGIRF